QGKSYVDFKNDLAEVVVDFLKPFQSKYNELQGNTDHVMSILESSETKAKEIASKNLNDIKSRMGLL
ncbi:MAG: tryptophan--tRNA ligase, partial [Candidatus Yanofskybacteria bacterium]|nr:tryptophan--tRNA ligase [Candidatus Yanofskybacteria bacterium]